MRYTSILIAIIYLFILTSCDRSIHGIDQETIDQSLEELQSGLNLSKDELRKLRQLEYKVVTLSNLESDDKLELYLSELGKERWNCFEVIPAATNLRIFCSRPVETPLRYIPGGLRRSISGNF